MNAATFGKYQQLIYSNSGIFLNTNKIALLKARLAKRMRVLGIQDHDAYLRYIEDVNKDEEIVNLLDVVSTNVTSFFREDPHFSFTQRVFSEWLEQKQTRFRFWSSACSTGEEPLTLGMILLECMAKAGRKPDVRILGTDISPSVLREAIAGRYRKDKMDKVPATLLKTYFHTQGKGPDQYFEANRQLKEILLFRRLNLSKPPFPMQGPMDIIFCRNVMIYFSREVRQRLIDEMGRLVKPGGYLMVGHSESLSGIRSDFKTIQPAIYQKA